MVKKEKKKELLKNPKIEDLDRLEEDIEEYVEDIRKENNIETKSFAYIG